ncbi:MAG: hypothetical protein KAR42_14700 [candidate division Zixibacteria bacterium]|nr:hypothetical protein [candidate division Zixibacteria bacterium]
MSEYLELLKRRRDATPPPGNAPNVQSNVSFRKAIDYIERLETELSVSNATSESRGEKLRDGLETYRETRHDLLRICKELDVAKDLNKRLEAERIPEELFDGYAVLKNISIEARNPNLSQVSDILDSVIKLIKERIENV